MVLDAADLSTDAMQRIASEMNYSETTFVTSREPRDGGFPVRIFTPVQELPFAGHPTLGTAWVLREASGGAPSEVRLDLGVGPVPVRFEPEDGGSEVAWLAAPPVEVGETLDPEAVAPAVGLRPEDLDPRAPVQRLAAGFPKVLVPVRGLDALRRSRLDLERWALGGDPRCAFVFCDETRSPANDLSARFFFEAQGVREDPATGSANACLGAYLVMHRWLGKPEVSVRVEQGHEVGRPSLLRVRARERDGGVEVAVGGRVVPAAHGELLSA